MLSPTYMYGEINNSYILSLLVADKNHILEFFTLLPTKLIIYVIFILISTYILIIFRCYLITKLKTNLILSLLFISHLFFYQPIKLYINDFLTKTIDRTGNFIIKDLHNINVAYKGAKTEIKKQHAILKAKAQFKPQTTATEFDTYVVVVGESARRDALHAYGFNIANTPFFDNVPKVQFNNYIAIGGNTLISLSNMFILNYHKNSYAGNTVLDLANMAGFKTYWLSNQAEIGLYDSVVSGIGKRANHVHFLNYESFDPFQQDIDLLPHAQQAINQPTTNKKVIFIHLYGSHGPFCNRTKGKYDEFHVSDDLSCYVQSIKQTDALLQDIYQMLQQHKQQTNKEWAMVYFSDHGLTKNNDDANLYHGGGFKANYSVPFVLLNSKLTATSYINAQRSGFNFFDFFAKWLGIKDNLLPNNCNFISEDDCPNSNIVITPDNKEVDYFSLGDEDLNYFK